MSERCRNITASNSSLLLKFPCEITEEVEGKTELVLKSSDIKWEMAHSSFAVEFDLNCNIGSTKERKTLLSSIFFAGALTGLFLGSFIYDQIGRKKSAWIGYVSCVLVTLLGTFCHDYYFLLVIRFFQGISTFICSTALYILTVELLPAKYRNYVTSWSMFLWASGGIPIATGVGYFVKDWNYMFLASSIIYIIFNLQVIICIESPRYFLIKGDAKSAKMSIKALAALTKSNLDVDKVELEDLEKSRAREQSFWQQLVDLCSYPVLLVETLLQMFMWFFIGMSYYGFNFGWGAILPDRYLGYLMGAVGEAIAYVTVAPLIALIGRRRSMMLLFVLSAVFYLIGIANVELKENSKWTLESVSCLFGIVFISACFSTVYLWTAELAPTSHRGFVFSVSSSAARIGSFLGPYIFQNLKPITHKAVPLGGLAFLAVVCAFASFILVETGDKEIALTGEDVATRRKHYKYRL